VFTRQTLDAPDLPSKLASLAMTLQAGQAGGRQMSANARDTVLFQKCDQEPFARHS
jgi:hypothetical protein